MFNRLFIANFRRLPGEPKGSEEYMWRSVAISATDQQIFLFILTPNRAKLPLNSRMQNNLGPTLAATIELFICFGRFFQGKFVRHDP